MTERDHIKRGLLNLWNAVCVMAFLPAVLLTSSGDWISWGCAAIWLLYIAVYTMNWLHEQRCPYHPERDYPGPINYLRRIRDDLRPAGRWISYTWRNSGGW